MTDAPIAPSGTLTPMTVRHAMTLLETGRFDAAEAAFAAHVGPTHEGVIARFRRAECLSRLGRHDEAVEEARLAREDDTVHPPASLWLATVLAEAGRYEEAADVPLPGLLTGEDERMSAAFLALADLAADRRDDVERTVARILAARHPPVLSLALRLAERHRAAAPDHGPDPGSLFLALEALDTAECRNRVVHPELPDDAGRRPDGTVDEDCAGDSGHGNRFVRLLRLTGGFAATVAALEPDWHRFRDADEQEFEERLRADDRAGAEAVLDRVAAEADPSELSHEYALRRARIEQLGGRPSVVEDHPGGEDARIEAPAACHTLDLFAACLRGDDAAAVDPAHALARADDPYAVIVALAHWALPRFDSQAATTETE